MRKLSLLTVLFLLSAGTAQAVSYTAPSPSRIPSLTVPAIPSVTIVCETNADCSRGSYCSKSEGSCGGSGVCKELPEICTMIYAPVCGCDGGTYGSACVAAGAGVNVAYSGECVPVRSLLPEQDSRLRVPSPDTTVPELPGTLEFVPGVGGESGRGDEGGAMELPEEGSAVLPGEAEGFNPQPEPPGEPAVEMGVEKPGEKEGFNPQPEPPGEPEAEMGVEKPGEQEGFNPQPDPPKEPAVNVGIEKPGEREGFNPQPDPPRNLTQKVRGSDVLQKVTPVEDGVSVVVLRTGRLFGIFSKSFAETVTVQFDDDGVPNVAIAHSWFGFLMAKPASIAVRQAQVAAYLKAHSGFKGSSEVQRKDIVLDAVLETLEQ